MDWKEEAHKQREKQRKWDEAATRQREFNAEAKVVSTDVVVDYETEDNDKTETVQRLVEGKLAEDVRKRLSAPADAPVLVEEVRKEVWVSDATGDTDYRMTVKCNGVEKEFNFWSAQENFRKLLAWLDEVSLPAVGKE